MMRAAGADRREREARDAAERERHHDRIINGDLKSEQEGDGA